MEIDHQPLVMLVVLMHLVLGRVEMVSSRFRQNNNRDDYSQHILKYWWDIMKMLRYNTGVISLSINCLLRTRLIRYHLPSSQFVPVHPASQEHVYPLTPFTHWPFAQGLVEHSSISTTKGVC